MDIKELKRIVDNRWPDGSMVEEYENGYSAHLIDQHPHGKIYRNVHNDTGLVAFTDENIMLLNACGVVVMFIKDYANLEEIEKSMGLVKKRK